MTIGLFMDLLEQQGVAFELVDDVLCVEVPPGALSEAQRHELAARRAGGGAADAHGAGAVSAGADGAAGKPDAVGVRRGVVMGASARPQLTPAQWRVLERVAQGESNTAIAAALGLTDVAVRNQVRAIYRRLPLGDGGHQRVQAVLWYQREGHKYREEAGGIAEPGQRILRPAEWRILERLARGESDPQIAAALGLSPWTVKGHLARIYRRLPLDDAGNRRVGAVRWYLHTAAPPSEAGVDAYPIWAALTPQQRAVLGCLAVGRTDDAIARELGLAPRTIKNRLTALYRVVPRGGGGSKRVAAVIWYLRAGRIYREEAHDAGIGTPEADADPVARVGVGGGAREQRHDRRGVGAGPEDGRESPDAPRPAAPRDPVAPRRAALGA